MEKILKIQESNEEINGYITEGYSIITDKQQIKLVISNSQYCCESWGYFMSEDNLDEFIGAELIDIKLTDEALNKNKLVDVYEGGIMFVDLETNKGILQFVAYNQHNGYYCHYACILSEQLKHQDRL